MAMVALPPSSSRRLDYRNLPLLFVFLYVTLASNHGYCEQERAYIIHVSKPPESYTGSLRRWHEGFLPTSGSLLYSFRHVISGFIANLTTQELDSIKSTAGFLHAEHNRILKLHTTYTPSFLGLHSSPSDAWNRTFHCGRRVIIGVLDTGISPTHPSFNDDGMPPPPRRWKGQCKFKPTSLCNNKLIGARSFDSGVETSSPFDFHGHGTHTAATAAGNFVPDACVLKSACGTAAGIAPGAHLAIYKVCNPRGCPWLDIVMGMDVAISDGVDVISMSLGGYPHELHMDPLAVASFGAFREGVFFAASAGNDGPSYSTVTNVSPWMLTVGASTTDRRIRAVVKLGNGVELEGESAYPSPSTASSPDVYLPLLYPRSSQDYWAPYCTNQTTLQNIGVQGKIVLCWNVNMHPVAKTELLEKVGAAGVILMGSPSRGNDTYAYPSFLPSSYVTYNDGITILRYAFHTSNPTAAIDSKGTTIGSSTIDPAVSAFSSRGPSSIHLGILKPDVIGPGVNVLAAWPEPVGPLPLYPPFNFLSGTSMSCPHLAGVAALLRSSHPDWSPSMIKSAIMTTTRLRNTGGDEILDLWRNKRANFYQMGAGHVHPSRANKPGLVYDISSDDYVSYLCGLGYTDSQVSVIAHETITCSERRKIEMGDLNYPSISVAFGNAMWVNRTVTNVGEAASSYSVRLVRPVGLSVEVKPERLDFTKVGEKRTFAVRFGINRTETGNVSRPFVTQGYLTWTSSDLEIDVRSPLTAKVGFSSRSASGGRGLT